MPSAKYRAPTTAPAASMKRCKILVDARRTLNIAVKRPSGFEVRPEGSTYSLDRRAGQLLLPSFQKAPEFVLFGEERLAEKGEDSVELADVQMHATADFRQIGATEFVENLIRRAR
ncbi:hypothetical protein K3175_07400 [Qipengyuania sp. GH1]|uniref:hypothetical protein n=1 Tax=Qipengyuania aestuarii TaxID=2867241 RepID=UPI001C872E0B|nr:hypothetical protein [Qipengyuania aestuarii]MBX7535484.1 hypothetical protein [Qipengyuania aestuarii]